MTSLYSDAIRTTFRSASPPVSSSTLSLGSIGCDALGEREEWGGGKHHALRKRHRSQ